jgi:hypothetical protein
MIDDFDPKKGKKAVSFIRFGEERSPREITFKEKTY